MKRKGEEAVRDGGIYTRRSPGHIVDSETPNTKNEQGEAKELKINLNRACRGLWARYERTPPDGSIFFEPF